MCVCVSRVSLKLGLILFLKQKVDGEGVIQFKPISKMLIWKEMNKINLCLTNATFITLPNCWKKNSYRYVCFFVLLNVLLINTKVQHWYKTPVRCFQLPVRSAIWFQNICVKHSRIMMFDTNFDFKGIILACNLLCTY